jgi:hypothetical protein
MLDKYNAKGKFILFLAFTVVGTDIGLCSVPTSLIGPSTASHSITCTRRRVLEFLERTGWKPRSEKVIVEKVGDDLGLARAVLLKKSNDGVSVPGVLFLVGRQYILVGRLFDSQTGRDLSPDLFGRVPITFDVNRLNLNNLPKRGSEHPKVVMSSTAIMVARVAPSLKKSSSRSDNFPIVQHVYKHFPLSDGSRYSLRLQWLCLPE